MKHGCITILTRVNKFNKLNTRDIFYVRRVVDLKKIAKVNAYIMHISRKIDLSSIHAT